MKLALVGLICGVLSGGVIVPILEDQLPNLMKDTLWKELIACTIVTTVLYTISILIMR